MPPRTIPARPDDRAYRPDPRQFRSAEQSQIDDSIERLAWIMDGSIPLPGGYTIGLDPIIGLVPGIGDLIGTCVSGLIVVQATRAGIPRATLWRMVANIAIDSLVGAVPFFGDLFDFAFKANRKNLELYRSAISGTHDTRRDYGFLLILFLVLALLISIPILLIFFLARVFFP